MQAMTYIIDRDGKPLMPTKRGNIVRHLLKRGEARIVRYEPFTVMILRDVGHCVQAVTLGVDTGANHVGFCAATEKKVLYTAQVELRTDMSELLTTRREFRRRRRYHKHNWYRSARWANRANQRNKSLPPSVHHKADSHIRAIKKVCQILPISKVRLEIGKFDGQKIANPYIQGEQYQLGTLANWENLKAYAKWRDGYKCRACGKSKHKDGVKLNVHHIIRKADGGTDVPENVVTLCEDCHKAHHRGERKLKFKRPPQHKAEAHMNAMRKYLVAEAKKKFVGLTVEVTYGYLTKIARREHGVEKTHMNDAFCVAGNFEAEQNDANIYHHHFIRRHRRNLHAATIKSPRKLSASVKKKLSMKMRINGFRVSTKMSKKVKGFALYDTVTYKGERWTITSLRTRGYFNLTRFAEGLKEHACYKYLSKRNAANGWVTEHIPPM